MLQGGTTPSSTTTTMTLTLGGLTNGQAYLVELWANDAGGLAGSESGNIKTNFTASNAVTLDLSSTNALGGVGQWVTGSFTAAGTSQTIAVTADGVANHWPILNAFEVRTIAAVPEPGSVLLLTLGAGLLAARRRRMDAR